MIEIPFWSLLSSMSTGELYNLNTMIWSLWHTYDLNLAPDYSYPSTDKTAAVAGRQLFQPNHVSAPSTRPQPKLEMASPHDGPNWPIGLSMTHRIFHDTPGLPTTYWAFHDLQELAWPTGLSRHKTQGANLLILSGLWQLAHNPPTIPFLM